MENEQTEVIEQEEVAEVTEELTLLERVNKIAEENEKLLQDLQEQQEQLKQSKGRELTLEETMEKINLTTTLNKEGLDKFQGLFDLTTTEDRVAFLKNAVNSILVANSYQPKETAKQEAYDQAIKSGDVNSAIKFKFSKLFGK